MLLDLEPILEKFRDKAQVNATSRDKKSTLLKVKSELNPELSGLKPELKSGTSWFQIRNFRVVQTANSHVKKNSKTIENGVQT
jgi:hypothetical protein